MATQQGPKGSGGSHQSGGIQSKFSQDYIAAEGIFLAEGLFTTLQETQTPFEERHSRRGQRLDRRSRPRRIGGTIPNCLGIAAGGRMLFSHRRRQMLSF